MGFYENGEFETGVRQYLGIGGAEVFGGYGYQGGDILPEYRKGRTENGGEFRFGVSVPLLKNSQIDKRRARVLQAEYERKGAEPAIAKQQLNFLQAATVAYYRWLGAGQRLGISKHQRQLAADRMGGLETQVEEGMLGRIVLIDNERLLVSRDLEVVKAQREFETAALALSLYLRDESSTPIIAGLERLPKGFPQTAGPSPDAMVEGVQLALKQRPEILANELKIRKLLVDADLAENDMKPSLDLFFSGAQGIGESRYKDRSEFELGTGLEFKVPLQRRMAKGRLQEVEGELGQIRLEATFLRDRIAAEIATTYAALAASFRETQMASTNVRLTQTLLEAEDERFKQGDSDFLALQIREQANFDARIKALQAAEYYHRSQVAFDAACGALLSDE